MESILPIVIRSVTVYLFIILAIRLFGKKELSQLSIIDLVLILLISNSVQNAMVGTDSSLAGGLVAASSLFVVNWVLKNLIFRSEGLSRILQGGPIMLIYKGTIMEDHLKNAKITHEELEAAVREHGVEKIAEVDLAILEVDGNISVMTENFHKHSKKRRAHKSLTFNS
jgi:uncharacterized membrane protein YcaP (DUF421 family)